MSANDILRRIYVQVAREFRYEADKIVRRSASRARTIQLVRVEASLADRSDDGIFDLFVNWRKHKKVPTLQELLFSNEN
jgi:hypothetical protein